jgi:hypothetical protein
MRRVELFEAWVGEKSKLNPLADSIISELDKWEVNWVNVTSQRRKSHGGVAMMIPFDEIIKFFSSGYFSEEVLSNLPPSRRDIISIAKKIKNPTKFTAHARWSGQTYSGPTFIIMASGKVRQWLYDFKKVSSNDNVDVNPASAVGVNTGTKMFFAFLVGHIQHLVFRQFIEQATLEDLNELNNTQLQKITLVHAIITKYTKHELDSNTLELFDKIIRANRKSGDTLYRLLVSIKFNEAQYLEIFKILNDYFEYKDYLWIELARAKTAPREIRINALARIESTAELRRVFLEFGDFTQKELMDIYFDERSSDAIRTLAKEHPNFGDVVGDEGGILSDW